jgi:hypothetical protein
MISLSDLFQGKEPTYGQLKSVKIEKITRAAFVFMKSKAPQADFAQCETCVRFIRNKGKCEDVSAPKVDDDDSCGIYAHGKYSGDGTVRNLVTPEEAGFVSRKVRCENCMLFDPNSEAKTHCDLYTQLNRTFPLLFNLDRYVDTHDCCNAKTPGKRNPKVFGPIGPIPGPQDQDRA